MRYSAFLRFFCAGFIGLAVVFSSPASATPAAGYWWNPAAAGSGFVIEIQGTTMFMAGFLYAASGEATWVASNGPMTSPTQYSGSLITFAGGQTLTGAYQTPTQVTSALGTIAITFSDDHHASVTWPGGTIPIQRFDIVPNGSTTAQLATNPQTGWWLNETEGGRGFAIEVQNGSMYLAGYMYDATGNPIWYLASGSMTNPSLFEGEWMQFAGGLTLAGQLNSVTVANANVGSVTLQIANSSVATLTLPDGRQISLTRYNFGVSGLTLQAFAPAASAPAQLLQVTGTGFDPAQALTVTLFDSNGYSVSIPPVSETNSQFAVSVPAYVNAMTNAFGSGTVSLQVQQGSTQSNTLPGFQIQALQAATGTAGNATLSLIQASLAEAQKLQTSVKGTAQDTPALETAIQNQIFNLNQLVTNIQNVVQNGTNFTLGAVGGVDIIVTPTNIADVDNLIIATLQSLASPGTGGSALKKAAAVNPTCMSAEANAFAVAALTGGSTAAQAQTFLEAACKSSLCQAPANFLPAYDVYSGVGSTGLGVTNQGGFGTTPQKGPAAGLISTLIGNSATSVALNNLICLQSATDQATVQDGVANVTKLQQPIFSALLPKTSGELLQSLVTALTLSNIIAPPPPITAGGITGTWVGSYTVSNPSSCMLNRANWTANFVDTNGALSGTWTDATNDTTGTISGVETGGAASWSASGTGTGSNSIIITGAISNNGTQIIGSFTSTAVCASDPNHGTISGTLFGTKG